MENQPSVPYGFVGGSASSFLDNFVFGGSTVSEDVADSERNKFGLGRLRGGDGFD